MNMKIRALALSVLILLAGCTLPAQPAPPPATPPADTPARAMPKVGNPQARPTTVGITLEALGPGLVLQGHTSESAVHVELRKGSTVLQAADLEPKDDGAWGAAWAPPKEPGAEIVVTPKGQPDKVLVRGAVGSDMFVGLFYSQEFTAVSVKMTDKQKRLIEVTGKSGAPEGRFWVELRNHEKAYAVHEIKVQGGSFSAGMQLPPEAHTVYFYTKGNDGTAKLSLIVPVVVR